ncbi:uncharacterized protein V6R79_017429 [Siganus canaliculatus]
MKLSIAPVTVTAAAAAAAADFWELEFASSAFLSRRLSHPRPCLLSNSFRTTRFIVCEPDSFVIGAAKASFRGDGVCSETLEKS